MICTAGCAAIGATVEFWIGPVFGHGFSAAFGPTLLLLLSAVASVPGLMAATGIAAWGRPGLRSIGYLAALLVNASVFIVLVPRFGVWGACWASVATAVVLTIYMLCAATRVMSIPIKALLIVRAADCRLVWSELRKALRALPVPRVGNK
jgi:O-antigen/teichoic acid export membrane protein